MRGLAQALAEHFAQVARVFKAAARRDFLLGCIRLPQQPRCRFHPQVQ